MSEQTEASQQSDWILPPVVGANGISNVVAVSAGTVPVIVDLTTIPSVPGYYDTFRQPRDGANPLGHYVNIQAQLSDVYFQFGPSVASMTSGQVSAVTISPGGSGYTSPTTVAFSGGGGSGAAGTVQLSGGVVASITMTAAGSGYSSAPSVVFTSPSGSGATGTAVLGATPSASTLNAVSAAGVVTQSAGTCPWIPVTQTLPVKLPPGQQKDVPHGQASQWRYLAVFSIASGGAIARIWQSSP